MLTGEFKDRYWVNTREIFGGDILVRMKDVYISKKDGFVLDIVLAEYPDYHIVSIAYEPTNGIGGSRLAVLLRKKNV